MMFAVILSLPGCTLAGEVGPDDAGRRVTGERGSEAPQEVMLEEAASEAVAPEHAGAVGDIIAADIDPANWPALSSPPLDPGVEARVDAILAAMTLEQKVGQVIQADSASVTPEEVRRYRLGSVLSGGNSAPGGKPYADAASWLAAADAFHAASVDAEGVEVAIPVIWGIDAVHGHANLVGATIFPHNIGLGAANDPELIGEIARVTALELTVSGHDWTFAPTLAVPRDDRWGRTYEGFSEDPAIVASYADRIVVGLQGRPGAADFMGPGRVISSAKHFVGDGGTQNGVDQGDSRVSETEMRDIHAAGYYPAIEAGVQTVMASYNSWHGMKMHGHKAMLTDILKGRMGFSGFVIGDWNGHGQIEGCTNTECPEAMLAGLDMYMAPDSWKGLYDSTLAGVQGGEIPLSRLDDAVRRILRVKVASGLFEAGAPSTRPNAGKTELLGSPQHRALARQAVRQSLVLLKNDGGVLPLDAGQTVLVVGPGAGSIAKASGGWTLSWQGGVDAAGVFPNAQSILSGIREVVEARGGRVVYDPEGTSGADADVVIAVYGEDPYAEFRGDRDHLDFEPEDFDTSRLAALGAGGRPVVSVFLSGRPLWVNPEINASDAFVAAWLPGSEGGGVADMLFRTDPSHHFTGRLSFSWPASAVDFDNNTDATGYAPLFPLGFGRSYDDTSPLGVLPEDSGIAPAMLRERGAVFVRGKTAEPWRAYLVSPDGDAALLNGTSANTQGLSAVRVDHLAQEDALALTWRAEGASLAFLPEGEAQDWSREANGAMELGFAVRAASDTELVVAMGCTMDGPCADQVTIRVPASDWREVRLALSCFQPEVDFTALPGAITLRAGPGSEIGLANVRLVEDDNGQPDCGG